MKSLIAFFTGLFGLFAAFFWLCGHYAATMPAPKNAAPPAPDAGRFTPNARRPPVGSHGPCYRVTGIGTTPINAYMTATTSHQDAENIQTAVRHLYTHDQTPSGPRLRRFPPLTGYTSALSVADNKRGEIVGYCKSVGSGAYTMVLARAFLWQRGRMHPLETLPDYQITHAVALNDRGVIVGDTTIDSFPSDMDVPGHAVCWIGGKVCDLGTGFAHAVNNAGDIVGDSGTGPADYWHEAHALLWTHGYRYDLNGCIPPRSGWLLGQATLIDDQGRITGYGTFHGQPRVFRLTPR